MSRFQAVNRCALRTLWGGVVLGSLLIFSSSGCSEETTAVLGTEQAFSLYGVFTPQSDTQEVVVFPIEGRLKLREAGKLDARFTTTDLETGEVRAWRDSVVQEPGGSYEHVFWSVFRAEYGHTYRIEVQRPDGAVSTALAKVPVQAELVELEPRVITSVVILPVLVRGAVPRVMKIEVEYYVQFAEGETELTTMRAVIPYDGKQQQVEEGWEIPINLTGDRSKLHEIAEKQLRWDPNYGVVILGMKIRLLVASGDWDPPDGVFDPEVLVQPGTMSNVENGFGFIGAGYRLEATLHPEGL